MNLNDLLRREHIDPRRVLVLRHTAGRIPKLEGPLWSLAANKPEVFNAYQQSQNEPVETRMKSAEYVAAFVGHEPKRALFAGLYSVRGHKPVTLEEFWGIPANVELRDRYGLQEERPSSLWFDLVRTDFCATWIGRLVISWPPQELNWYRWAHEKEMRIVVPDESIRIGATVADELEQTVMEAFERRQGRGQGFQLNKVLRLRLEQYAMGVAKRYFESSGFTCEDHSKTQPYDLLCKRGNKSLHVEVKGTTTGGEMVILTAGEVKFARENRQQMALFILHSIQVSEAGDEVVLGGGDRTLLLPWDVDRGALRAVSFMYEVPTVLQYREDDV